MKKIKVLIIAGTMHVGGIENQLMYLIRNADKDLFQIDFTTTMDHPFYEAEILSLGGRCIKIPETGRKHFLRYCRVLYKVLKEGHYDIVHSNELFHSGMVLMTARLAGVKHRFAHAHSSNQDYGRDIVRHAYIKLMRLMIMMNGTQLLACSSLAAKFLYGDKVFRDNRYHLLVNSVDTEKFLSDPTDGRPEEFDNRWKYVLQVGRFSDEKNFLFTVLLARECKRRNNGIRFLCAGNNGGSYEKKVIEEIERYHLEDEMILLGVRKDVDQLMKSADAFILPSKYEGMPLTLIEAQASCLPCVVADTCSHEVDFQTGSVTWLSLNEDITEWVNGIEKAVEQGKTDKEKVIEAIRERGFDSKDFADKVCRYYLEAYREG